MSSSGSSKKYVTLRSVGIVIGSVLAFGVIGILLSGYVLPNGNVFGDRVRSLLPLPIVVLDRTNMITTAELTSNMRSVQQFYETQDFSKVGLRVDFSTPEGKKRFQVREKDVLNKMIEDKAIRILAKERGIAVSDESARDGVKRKIEEFGGGKDVEKNLARLYGWSMQDFQEKVVVPSLYEEKLSKVFEKEIDTDTAGKKRISEAQIALRSGKSFDEVARMYSEGRTAADGGELGWFGMKDLAEDLRKPVSAQKVGVPGEIVESHLGFHILLIEETKKENGEILFRLKQIFAKKVTFADWLTREMQKLPVWVWSRDYEWKQDEAEVQFRDAGMRQFERDLLEKTDGDALFFF